MKFITKNYYILSVKIFFISMMISFQSQAAIALDRTRIIFDGGNKSISLDVSNDNKELPYLAQGWVDDQLYQKKDVPFIVLPPIQRIEPGKQSQIKVQALPGLKSLPQDRESVFYFNLREIPPKSNKPNTLQIALQTRIKLFYRPQGISIVTNATPPQEEITLEKEGEYYLVNNVTPYFLTLVDASKGINYEGVKDFKPIMVPPKEKMRINVSMASLGRNPVITYVNDYGGRPQLTFKCGEKMCVVLKDVKKP